MRNDPKFIDKRSLYTKLMEQAGRDYCDRIAHTEDVFFAGPDTDERQEQFHQAMIRAEAMLHSEELSIEAKYGVMQEAVAV